MRLYNFARLIQRYSVTFTLCRSEPGRYVAGKYEPGVETQITMRGAIVPLRDSKLYGEGGSYTDKDRELYITVPLEEPLSEYKVLYDGSYYSVEAGRNFEDYADAAIYTLKWVSKA